MNPVWTSTRLRLCALVLRSMIDLCFTPFDPASICKARRAFVVATTPVVLIPQWLARLDWQVTNKYQIHPPRRFVCSALLVRHGCAVKCADDLRAIMFYYMLYAVYAVNQLTMTS